MISRDGTATVFPAGPTFHDPIVNTLEDSFSASPAISNGRIYLRGFKNLYAIGASEFFNRFRSFGDAIIDQTRKSLMSVKEALGKFLDSMSEEKLREVLEYAEFLNWRDEQEGYRQFGKAQFSRAYGDNEPEYSLSDKVAGSSR